MTTSPFVCNVQNSLHLLSGVQKTLPVTLAYVLLTFQTFTLITLNECINQYYENKQKQIKKKNSTKPKFLPFNNQLYSQKNAHR